jgi:hypothetical protein
VYGKTDFAPGIAAITLLTTSRKTSPRLIASAWLRSRAPMPTPRTPLIFSGGRCASAC